MLRCFLVDFIIWSEGGLQFSDDVPHLMLRDMVVEVEKKCDGKVRSPLLDIRN